MIKQIITLIFLGGMGVLLGLNVITKPALPEKLSDYGFFSGPVNEHQPAPGVIPYQLATPLFSDYAEKLRFVKLPPGKQVAYNDSLVFDFPVGTSLIKTFYYPVDFRNPDKGRKLIETRLLIRDEKGWTALPYIWNKEQTDAFLDVAGVTTEVTYVDASGKRQKHAYVVPDMNQCKGCHNKAEVLTPIGPSAWQLNGDMNYPEGKENQLEHWVKAGILSGLPQNEYRPGAVVWNEPSSGTLEERARIWLDINCGHCHQRTGPAGTSGMFLNKSENDPLRLGIGKTPVAAGRGSGGRQFGIVPGHPDQSILVYRMESKDPGIMMPELGRTVLHKEGIALIREWIRNMPADKGMNGDR